MRLLASALAATALASLVAGCADEDVDHIDDGVDTCYGGYGLVVNVTRGACADPAGATAAFDKTQITFTSGGAQQFYDLTFGVDRDSEVWPPGFQRGAEAQVDVLLYSEKDACRLTGSAVATVDPEVCATVTVATTCDCTAP
jgi:hypothetical protein